MEPARRLMPGKFGKARSILRNSMVSASHSFFGGLTRFIAATAVVSFLSTNARTRHSGRACLKLASERQAKVAHSRFSQPLTRSLRPCASGIFAFERDGRRGALELGDAARVRLGPVVSDMDQSEADAHMLLPGGFIWRDGRILNTDQCEVTLPSLQFKHANSSAFFSEVEYNV